MKKDNRTLSSLFKKVIRLLEKEKIRYLVIGGVAVSHIGTPRLTEDLDLILFIEKEGIKEFLSLAKKQGFRFNPKEQLKNLELNGCVRIFWTPLRVDILCASTDFEQEALKRKFRAQCYGVKANLPSPEDLILLKIVPGREKDILDAESIAMRHWKKLDLAYIEKWVQTLCDRSENHTFMHHFKRIINSCNKSH